MTNVINIDEWKNKRFRESWYPTGMNSFAVPVADGSHCVEMAVFNNQLLAVFCTPDRGLITFKIDPMNGTCEEVTI